MHVSAFIGLACVSLHVLACIPQCAVPEHCITQAIWHIQLAISFEVQTEAKLCFNPPVTLPIEGSMGHQLLPLLNSQGRTVDAMLPDGNCLFRSLSMALFAVSSGHLNVRKLIVQFIESNPRELGGLCNGPLPQHSERMRQAGVFGTQVELQAATSLFQVPVYIFQKPNVSRLWEWMVYKPQSKDRLDFSACPRIAALKPPTNFNIEMLYNAAHCDVIASINPTAIYFLLLS